MRPKSILAAVAALAVLALIVRQVMQAVRHTFTPPQGLAQIDRASPRTQNGLTLLEIDNVSPDRSYGYSEKGGPTDNGGSSQYISADTGLWIKMPSNFSLPPNCSQPSLYNGCVNLLSVTGRASTGETFVLPWHTSNDGGQPGSPTYLLADIPAGYPDTFRWVDVTLDDKRGNTATWRITHLPPMQHVLGPGTTARTTFQQGNVRATALAFGGPNPNTVPTYRSPTPVLLYDLKGTITGATHQWELGHLRQTLEWEPRGFTISDSGTTMGAGKTGSTVKFEMYQQEVYFSQTTPYLTDQHWVKLEAQLQEFETYDETVTFHNVSVFKQKDGGQYLVGPGPETVTTPSGITVTLDDVQHKPNLTSSWGGGGYCLHLLYPQTMLLPSLPQSPLWRKYKSAVRVSADIPKPYDSGGSSYGNAEGTYNFRTDKPLPPTLPTFRVIVRQRVDLSSVPMTFTLPVGSKPPKTPL